MGRPRKKRHPSSSSSCSKTLNPVESRSSDTICLRLQPLISALRSSAGLNASVLKSLYAYLVKLSRATFGKYASLDVSCHADIVELSNMLFKELDERFRSILCAMSDVSQSEFFGNDGLSLDSSWDIEGLGLLLRCCLTLLTLLDFNQNLIIAKTVSLLSILHRLLSFDLSRKNEERLINFKKLQQQYCHNEDGSTTSIAEDFVASLQFLEPSDPLHSLITTLLEVFADELLSNELLRLLFSSVDAASAATEKLFTRNDYHQNVGILFEIISAHMMLSISNEQAIENVLRKMFVQEGKKARVLELSMTASLGLLLCPIVLSAPKLFQAHLNFIVAEAIDVGTNFQFDNFITTFERSVYLYWRMSGTQAGQCPLSAADSLSSLRFLERSCPAFESFINQGTKAKLGIFVAKAEKLWSSYTSGMLFKSEAELLSASIEYANICCGCDSSCTTGKFSVLQCIIQYAFPKDLGPGVLYIHGDTNFIDIYLLSSILKLMSSSLYQIAFCARHQHLLDCPSTSKDVNLDRQHKFLLDIIRCFKQFGVNLPVQNFLFEGLKSHPLRHEEYTWMLCHFSGLLSLCFVSGHDFLIKACLSIIMTLVDLIILDGGMDSLMSLLCPGRESSSYCLKEEVILGNKFSRKVASTYLKIQRESLSLPSITTSCEPVIKYFAGLYNSVIPFPSQQDEIFEKETETYLYIRWWTHRPDLSLHFNPSDGEPRLKQPHAGSSHGNNGPVGVEERVEETSSGEIFVQCLLKGAEGLDDYDDLVDFIELKKGKDYFGWFRNREKYRRRKAERSAERTAVLKWKRRKSCKTTVK